MMISAPFDRVTIGRSLCQLLRNYPPPIYEFIITFQIGYGNWMIDSFRCQLIHWYTLWYSLQQRSILLLIPAYEICSQLNLILIKLIVLSNEEFQRRQYFDHAFGQMIYLM